MIRLAFCLLAFGPLAVAAQDTDVLIPLELATEAASVGLAADEPDDGRITCGGGDCLGSEEDQTACYVVAGIAATAFGAAAIVGLVREGDPCAYLSWGGGTCGECNELNGDEAQQTVQERPRRGVGITPAFR